LTLRNDQNTTDDGVGLFFSMHNTNPQDKGAGIIGKRSSDTNSEMQFITANSSTPSSKMTIKGDGKVGIGTDSPEATLHVKDAEVAGTVIIESSSNNTDNTAPEVKLLRSNLPSENLSVNDDLGQIRFQAYDNAGTPAIFNYSSIKTHISNHTDGSEEGALQLQVAQGGTGAGGGTTTMTLKGANVGIGIDAPAHTLSVAGDVYLDGMARFGRNASNTTISSGILTATHTVVRVVPESPTADDVDEITAGEDGDFLILSNASNTDTITYKHNNASTAANRLRLAGGADFAAVNRYDYIMLIYRSSGHAAWFEVSRSDNG